MTAQWVESDLIRALTFAVIRAGARDGMAWWDDEALTDAGAYALAKIFPRNPGRVAMRLGYLAARSRHVGVFAAASLVNTVSLFDLVQGEAELSTGATLSEGAIATPDELRIRLVALAPDVATVSLPSPRPDGILDLTDVARGASPVRTASILAAGYLKATKGSPVFPFVYGQQERRP